MSSPSAQTCPQKIVLVTSLLRGGGAERVVATMANHWAAQGREIEIIVARDCTSADYPVSPLVKVTALDAIGENNPWWSPQAPLGLLTLRRAIRRAKPGVVISFQEKLNAAVILALSGTRIPVIATEHLVPWCHDLGPVWSRLHLWCNRRAAGVTAPAQGIVDWLHQHGISHAIRLPYPIDTKLNSAPPIPRRRVILSAGRLNTAKGFDLILKAFARIDAPEWQLEIAGDGPERENLEKLAHELKIPSRIRWLGRIPDLPSHMKSVAIFALGSRTESFSMVLVEAASAGCALVSTDCPCGPAEILGTDGGILTPCGDVDAMADALQRMINSADQRADFSQRARQIGDRYRTENVMPLWDGFLQRWIKITPCA